MSPYYDQPGLRQRGPEDVAGVLVLFACAAVGFCWYVAVSRLHLRSTQCLEIFLYGAILIFGGGLIVAQLVGRKKKREENWPHPAVVIPASRDAKVVRDASQAGATLLGYNVHKEPWLWPDTVRMKHGVIVGGTGAGKSTFLENIIAQDLTRRFGARKMPMIIFDGKGEREFLDRLLPHIEAAGRLQDLRVIDPTHPSESARYNPFYALDDAYQEHVNFIFRSFGLREDFFKGHQEAYLSDLVRILQYTGRLFNVAGDQMKAASELGVPVVGVGLLYGQGYFRQDFDSEGRQQALYPVNDPGQLPIRPLRQPNGEWLRLQIHLPGSRIWLRCWEVSVGRTKLYLLDTNDFANTAAHRGITSELYGGDAEMRLKQEIVLGIGGWRLLRALGLTPEVCHLNEGHAAFAVLERARSYMEDHKKPFDLAMNITRAGNVFTTHTAVSAGFDRFDPLLIRTYLTHYAVDELAISVDDLLAMGKQNPEDNSEPFNMAYLAVRGSRQINGVSKLHGQVSREIFQTLFPRWPREEVPIGSVTNGIHVPTWDSVEADALWTSACGQKRWRGDRPVEDDIRQIPNQKLWDLRSAGRKGLIERMRKRYQCQLAAEGADPSNAAGIFDEKVLTLGFARRFATYKRPNLLLHDTERLVRLLSNPRCPVQFILAGKAHPQDLPGQELIKQWKDFIKRPEVKDRVVFLNDYDMMLAQELVQGIDLWINTPRRPWEACGTSGMKVLVNGGLNLSELDGWWAEAYSPEVGWAIGDGQEHGDDPGWDAQEAETLYGLLEGEVIPEFYQRDESGMPARWLGRIRESMARLTPEFSATRAIREYTESHYLPAASRYRDRAADDGALGASLLQWKQDIDRHWNTVRFVSVKSDARDNQHFFRVEIFPGGLTRDQIQAELYADSIHGEQPAIEPMISAEPSEDSPGAFVYLAEVSATRPASDFTARVFPRHRNASVPLEAEQIVWQR